MIDAPTLWRLVEARAAATPEALFAIDERDQRLSFEGLREAAERVAAGLHARGIREGDGVGWLLPTGLPAFVLMVALARLGAIQNPLVPIYRRREIEFCLDQTDARWLLVPGTFRGFDFAALASELERARPGLTTIDIAGALPTADPAGLSPASDTPEALRWIFYTSGTTSDPKGAQHSDASVLLSSRGLAEALDLGPTARTGVVFPVTHLGGANALASTLFAGSTQLVVEAFDPATTIPFLADHGVTHAGAGPVFYQAYLEAQRAAGPTPLFPELIALYGGGAPTPPPLHEAVRRELGGLGILSTYGMTECPVITMARFDDPPEKRATTEGRPTHPATRIRILDPSGHALLLGQEGEIHIHAPQLLQGFVDPRLDAEAFDTEGFFATGDRGRLDAEGYLTITGRTKDVIIRKGENISAAEVEGLLMAHARVAEVAVIGLPDETSGERACAVVRVEPGAAPLGFDEMVEHLEALGLMRQKIPEQLEHLDEMPRNPSGKIPKAPLVARFA
jgi:acyl-CoA synthetase (AMP-forming)/AMP-acid ligase II